MKKELLKQYQNLEKSVHDALRKAIGKSNIQSEHCTEKCLQIEIGNFTELVIVNGELTLIESSGYHYHTSAITIEDLISLIPE